MIYKNLLLIIVFLFSSNCSTENLITNKSNIGFINNYTNSGFTLIYNENLYKDKIISQQINERSITNNFEKIENKYNCSVIVNAYDSFFKKIMK